VCGLQVTDLALILSASRIDTRCFGLIPRRVHRYASPCSPPGQSHGWLAVTHPFYHHGFRSSQRAKCDAQPKSMYLTVLSLNQSHFQKPVYGGESKLALLDIGLFQIFVVLNDHSLLWLSRVYCKISTNCSPKFCVTRYWPSCSPRNSFLGWFARYHELHEPGSRRNLDENARPTCKT